MVRLELDQFLVNFNGFNKRFITVLCLPSCIFCAKVEKLKSNKSKKVNAKLYFNKSTSVF